MTPSLSPVGDEDDLDLAYTRSVRRRLIDHMSKDTLPSDQKDKVILLSALADMDRAALGKKRIKTDEGLGSSILLAAETLSQLYMNPRLKGVVQAPAGASGAVPELDALVALPALVSGELGENDTALNYDAFMARRAAPGF